MARHYTTMHYDDQIIEELLREMTPREIGEVENFAKGYDSAASIHGNTAARYRPAEPGFNTAYRWGMDAANDVLCDELVGVL